MAIWPTGGDTSWRKAISVVLHLLGIGALAVALFASGSYSAIILQ